MLGVLTGDASNTLVRLLEHLRIPFQVVGKNATPGDLLQYRALAVLADAYPQVCPDHASLHHICEFCEFLSPSHGGCHPRRGHRAGHPIPARMIYKPVPRSRYHYLPIEK